MNYEEFEETVEFVEIRQMSPQWLVRFNEHEIAIVTERYIAKPRLVAILNIANGDEEHSFETEEEVLKCLFENLSRILTPNGSKP